MGQSGYLAFLTLLSGLSWGFGYLGQPHLLIRYMAINDVKNVKITRNIAISWAVPGVLGAFMIGIISPYILVPSFWPTTLKNLYHC